MTVAGMTRAPHGTAPSRHLPALDGLRGIAILGVLAFHTGMFPGGFLGVDLFFALSGFLITGLLLTELRTTGSISLPRFWARRLRRLLPASAVVLAVVTLTVWTLGRVGAVSTDLVRTTLADGPWVQMNLVNWHLLAEQAGYWDRFGQARVFEHLWSIAVEEQFYLVWPLLVLAVAWIGRAARVGRAARPARWGLGRAEPDRVVPVVAGVVSLVSLVVMIVLVDPADPTRVYTGTDTRAFSLLLGAAVAAPPVRAWVVRATAGRAGVVSLVLATVIAALWLLADGTGSPWLFTGGLFVHSLASALLIALVAQVPRSVVARGLGWRPLRWLGGISYALYLWHWPVAVLLDPEVLGPDGWLGTASVWLVSIALAAASTYLLENPIRFRASWARGRTGVYVLVAVGIALVLLWLLPTPAPTVIDISDLT